MKKYLLLFALCCFMVGNVSAQSTAPTSSKIKSINTTLLWKAIGNVNIPVYRDYSENATIDYLWYSTKMVFGEEQRESDTPSRTEKGKYVNGRLSMYHKSNAVYRLEWSYEGLLTSVTQYKPTGEEIGRYGLSSFGLKWVDRLDRRSSGKGASTSASIYISNVVLQDETCHESLLYLDGYYVSGDWLYNKTVVKSLEKVSGQVAKKWVDRSATKKTQQITEDGILVSNSSFDWNNSIRCEAYYVD
ncbi:MAG: hypothetical protein E7135_07520 [Rikenellaceae bacterium]|nr:hypothetical protein [Rikenellaceae bacterium]